jgi:hypothetical protein
MRRRTSFQKSLLKVLKRNNPEVAVINAAPLEDDKEAWEWHQRNICFMWKPFKYKIGPFYFKIKLLSWLQYLELEDSITENRFIDFICNNSTPSTTPINPKRLNSKIIKLLITRGAPLPGVSGIVSEFQAFLTAVKKKMLVINPNGVLNRGKPTPSTILRKIGSEWDAPILDTF